MRGKKKKKGVRIRWRDYIWLFIGVCLVLAALAVNLFLLRMPASVKGPLYGDSQLTEAVQGELKKDDRAPDGMKLAAENDDLALFFSEKTSEIALLHKASQEWWYSCPSEETIQAASGEGPKLKSILQIRYYDQNNTQGNMNSYQNSVSNGTFSFEFIPNGIRMLFVFEKGKITRAMLPAVVEKEKFEERILTKLSDDEKEAVEKYYLLQKPSELDDKVTKKQYQELYPALDMEAEYYFLDLYAPDFRLASVYQAIYGTAEYTVDDVVEDNETAGYDAVVDTFVRFEIPVECALDGGGLTVSIPASQIEAPEECRLTELVLMPYFGCAAAGEEGYLFVPDGAGALIRFDNGKSSAYSYHLPVYGEDKGIERDESSFSTAKANAPVFGIVYENSKAMLAVIEEGESHGVIEADVPGSSNSCSWVGTRFQLTPMAVESFSSAQVIVETKMYQEEPYGGRISMQYLFAGEEGADYAGLAGLYRDYLKERGVLKAQETEGIRFHLKLTAKIEREASFMGIPYKKEQTVTTFAQAGEIAKRLREEGVADMNIGIVSWFGGGIRNDAVTGSVSAARSLGGEKELSALLSEAEGSGSVGLGADLLNVYEGWPHFNQFFYASRFLNNTLAAGYTFNQATLVPDRRRSSFYYLSPRYLDGALESFSRSAGRYGVSSLWLTDAGKVLASDFRSGGTIDREMSKELISHAAELAAGEYSLTVSDANQYLWKYLDAIVDLPSGSSGHILLDETVPFLQIVLSGHMDYASGAMNRSGDLVTSFLKAAETGSGLYYEWIYERDDQVSAMRGPETEEAYSMSYETWIDAAALQYRRLKEDLACVAGKEITGHHMAADGVFCTQYGDISVIVNYNDYDVDVDGAAVPARDFTVLR